MTTQSSSSYRDFETRRRNPNPKTAVLLVIDAQNYFSSMVGPILPALKATIDLCRGVSIPVIFTRHCHKSPADYGMLGEWWGSDLVYDGTPQAELMSELGLKEGHDQVDYSLDDSASSTRTDSFTFSKLRMQLIERIRT